MKKILRILSVIISVIVLFTGFSNISIASDISLSNGMEIDNNAPMAIDEINEFVTRLYSLALDRTPDKQGIDAWASVLTEQRGTGVSVAYGFIFSNEFRNKEVTNEEYVKLMYQMFFGREADQAGLEGWVKVMDSMDKEAGRHNVFSGFANSKEFFELCKSYGIISGTFIEGKDVDQVAKVNLFVQRLYSVVLGRDCDQGGMNGWTNALLSGENTGAEAAYGFFFSEEYAKKGKTNYEYVDDLYHAFMGRDADESGRNSWVKVLSEGGSREEVFDGFTQSDEFGKICESYGIIRGGSIVKKVEFNPVPLNELANYSSIKKKMSDAEYQEAYNAALEIVRPLVGLSREEQLYGVALAIRYICDNGLVYSTSNAHYNDPYGYFILGTGSCAGCVRATGLCLNILGIPYEHVNENQNTHQWARINVNGTYWICDAFGLYCGPEPSPYQHPYIAT